MPKLIHLITIDTELATVLESAEGFARRYGADIASHLQLTRDVVRQTLDLYARVHPVPPWVGYLTVAAGDEPSPCPLPDKGRRASSNVVVGCCGFPGKPTGDGVVEIAYFTFPEYERRGFATAMARELVDMARTAPDVRHVIAHTLPTVNASTRVLEKCGFQKVGEGYDPDAGRVWRWRLELATVRD